MGLLCLLCQRLGDGKEKGGGVSRETFLGNFAAREGF